MAAEGDLKGAGLSAPQKWHLLGCHFAINAFIDVNMKK
jgi:hypothetical protein